MSVLHGRERWLYSARPGLDRFNAVWFGVLGVLLAVVGITLPTFLGLVSLPAFGVAAFSWQRARWTLAHPEVRRDVTQRFDAKRTRHPVRFAVLAAVAFALVGADELYRYTLGSRGDGQAPPLWAWFVVAIAGALVGLLIARVQLTRARRRQAGELPYPGEPEYRDSYGSPTDIPQTRSPSR